MSEVEDRTKRTGRSYQGLEPLGKRINVRNTLARIREDPLVPFLTKVTELEPLDILNIQTHNEISRYRRQYEFYHLAIERHLTEISLATRWRSGPYYALKDHKRMSKYDQKLHRRYVTIERFIEMDYFDCLLHSRILLDRVTSLSRFFLKGSGIPSFTSFYEHKKFFAKQPASYGLHEKYANHIRLKTDWFDVLTRVRDKFVVHAGPKHMRIWGIPAPNFSELDLFILSAPDDGKNQEMIHFSVARLVIEIDRFLRWFCKYGLSATDAITHA